jgi:ferredoxin, 2Fe-2S
MPTLFVVDRAGAERRIDAVPGRSVMQVIRDAGYDDLLALCGGCCSCATCHVYVDPASSYALPPMSVGEDDLLDALDSRRADSRLSCQISFGDELDGLKVTIAPED